MFPYNVVPIQMKDKMSSSLLPVDNVGATPFGNLNNGDVKVIVAFVPDDGCFTLTI